MMEINLDIDRVFDDYILEIKKQSIVLILLDLYSEKQDLIDMNEFYIWAKSEIKKCNETSKKKATLPNMQTIRERANNILNIL